MTSPATYHRGKRDFGTGYDMMQRIDELEAGMREILTGATSRNHALDIARRALHGDKLQK
jgi:hypothetical protein